MNNKTATNWRDGIALPTAGGVLTLSLDAKNIISHYDPRRVLYIKHASITVSRLIVVGGGSVQLRERRKSMLEGEVVRCRSLSNTVLW